MDLTPTIEPKSDQINADDLLAGPQTVTITEVTRGNAEQPVSIVTDVFGKGRPYKPGKSMRRVLVAIWGKDSKAYVGQQMTLYCDPTIRFGKDEVGGIRISHMTGLDKPTEISLTVTRGQRKPFRVSPLVARDWAHEIESATTRAELLALLDQAPERWRETIISAGKALSGEKAPEVVEGEVVP